MATTEQTQPQRIAFVTGSSRGIGRATVLLLARRGYRVVLHGHAGGPGTRLAEAVAACGAGAEWVAGNFDSPEAVVKLAGELKGRGLAPDVLVLNASTQDYMGVENFAGEPFARMFRTNVESSFLLLRELLPEMRRRRFGRVIFVGSINGIRPASRLAVYAASKAALQNLAQTVAHDNAAYGITVNTVLPGVIPTDRNAAALSDQEFSAKLLEAIPMHRFGTPEECAEAVAFLASEMAGYVTGAEIPIAGGM